MDNAQWSQLIGAIVLFLGILGAFIQSRSNAKTLSQTSTKVDQVHYMVNSHLTAVVSDLTALGKWITDNAKPGDPPVPVLQSETSATQPEVPKEPNV